MHLGLWLNMKKFPIVDGNDLLLSYTCSFMRLLECEVMLLHSIGGPYRGIEKSEIFI